MRGTMPSDRPSILEVEQRKATRPAAAVAVRRETDESEVPKGQTPAPKLTTLAPSKSQPNPVDPGAMDTSVFDVSSTEQSAAFWLNPRLFAIPLLQPQITADIGQLTDSYSPMTFSGYKDPGIEHKFDKKDDDIRSNESIPDDIGSPLESTSEIVHYRQTAAKYYSRIFTSDSELLALYREATHSMGEAKFVENHRRLLKKFFLDLCSEGYTPSQKLAVELLRSRSKRIDISSEICRLVMSADNTVLEKINVFPLDSFLGEEDSTAQLATTNTAGKTSDNEPIIRPRITDNAHTASEENEDSDNDEDMSSDESETEIEDDSVLSKLVATEEFLTSGRPLGLYKENLRAFLHSVHKAAHLPVNLHSGIQAKRTEGGELFDLDYDISFARGFNSAIQDICKTVIEHIAGCQLSWWPLSCPEAELEVGYIRVYSMPFVSSKLHSKLKQSLTNIFSYSEAGAFMTIFRHLSQNHCLPTFPMLVPSRQNRIGGF